MSKSLLWAKYGHQIKKIEMGGTCSTGASYKDVCENLNWKTRNGEATLEI